MPVYGSVLCQMKPEIIWRHLVHSPKSPTGTLGFKWINEYGNKLFPLTMTIKCTTATASHYSGLWGFIGPMYRRSTHVDSQNGKQMVCWLLPRKISFFNDMLLWCRCSVQASSAIYRGHKLLWLAKSAFSVHVWCQVIEEQQLSKHGKQIDLFKIAHIWDFSKCSLPSLIILLYCACSVLSHFSHTWLLATP